MQGGVKKKTQCRGESRLGTNHCRYQRGCCSAACRPELEAWPCLFAPFQIWREWERVRKKQRQHCHCSRATWAPSELKIYKRGGCFSFLLLLLLFFHSFYGMIQQPGSWRSSGPLPPPFSVHVCKLLGWSCSFIVYSMKLFAFLNEVTLTPPLSV